MADRITGCPHCSTSFRVTDAQLQTAKGAVRCGSCLHIFKAADHFLDDPIAEDQAPDSVSEGLFPEDEFIEKELGGQLDNTDFLEADLEQLLQDESDEDELGLFGHDPYDDEHLDNLPQSDDTADHSLSIAEPAQASETAHPPTQTDKVEDNQLFNFEFSDQGNSEPLEEHPDHSLISDDMDQQESPLSVSLGGELNPAFHSDGYFGDHTGSLFDRDVTPNEEEIDSADESWAISLLSELEEDVKASTEIDNDTNAQTKENTLAGLLQEPNSSREESAFNLTGHLAAPTPEQTHRPASREDDSTEDNEDHLLGQQLLQSINPAPVEMNWQREKSKWPARLLWASLSIFAALTLLLQLGWANFNDYSKRPDLRPWYSKICELTGCQLPALVEPQQIKAYNLIVRSHPRINGALIVDCILLNTANFDQPFPNFELTFSNLQSKPIAARRFTPSEYLNGELKDATIMPSNQPVHISLEVLDPGPEAVNYNASIPTL